MRKQRYELILEHPNFQRRKMISRTDPMIPDPGNPRRDLHGTPERRGNHTHLLLARQDGRRRLHLPHPRRDLSQGRHLRQPEEKPRPPPPRSHHDKARVRKDTHGPQ